MSQGYVRSVAVAWCVLGMLAALSSGALAFTIGKYEKVTGSGGLVTIATAKLADGKARYYKFEEGGKEIAFFAVKAADGSYRTAFDACDACYRSRKGYDQQGDRMNCNNCNQKFAIAKLGPNATGGCNPGYLPSQVGAGAITIRVSDLKSGARYF